MFGANQMPSTQQTHGVKRDEERNVERRTVAHNRSQKTRHANSMLMPQSLTQMFAFLRGVAIC